MNINLRHFEKLKDLEPPKTEIEHKKPEELPRTMSAEDFLQKFNEHQAKIEEVRKTINTQPSASVQEKPKNLPDLGPSELVKGKLDHLDIDYEELVEAVPGFASMSEGQQAYILYKAEEASIDKIHEIAQERFQEEKKNSGWFTRTFKKASLQREVLREVADEHRGLSVFTQDITLLTDRVEKNGNEIIIEPQGNYRIEYAKVPQELDPKDPFRLRVENYNRAATAFSDVPYEWGLPTASRSQKKIFDKARDEFKNHEKLIRELRAKGERELLKQEGRQNNKSEDEIQEDITRAEGDILIDMHALRSNVEADQLLSSYQDVAQQFSNMENATWQSQASQKLSDAFSRDYLTNNTSKFLILGSGAVGRMISKTVCGFGGAVGASAVIGGFLGVRKKNEQFKKDSIAARRGVELKKTTDRVFDAKANVNRIEKLLQHLETIQYKDPKDQELTLSALQDRLQLLDKRLKEGRVNFGKPKEQLQNKSDLITAMANAYLYKEQIIREKRAISGDVNLALMRKDARTQTSRRVERVKGAVTGALAGASFGALSSTVFFMLTDYFKGEDVSKKVFDAIQDGAEKAGISFSDIGESIQNGADKLKDWVSLGGEGSVSSGGMAPETPQVPPTQVPLTQGENFPGVGAGKEG